MHLPMLGSRRTYTDASFTLYHLYEGIVCSACSDSEPLYQSQEARKLTQKVLNLDANNGHAWHTLGQLEEQQGKLEAALTCYSAGQQSNGAFLPLVRMLASTLSHDASADAQK